MPVNDSVPQRGRRHAMLIPGALAALLLACSTASAAEPLVVSLWPKGLPAGAKVLASEQIEKLKAAETAERISYVEQPTLTIYPAAEEKANGCGVIVCPGGGYHILAWQKEGVEVAQWFNSLGVTAAVLKYRVPRRDLEAIHQEPLQDAQRAIRVFRHRAQEWKVDVGRVGILGFSAGGHLTVMAGTHWKQSAYPAVDEADELSCRPDFMCPIYAAYLGPEYRDDVAELGSLVKVNAETPPTFLAVTWDDKMRAAQSALLAVELRKANVPAELHIYAKGGHGYGIRPSGRPVETWHHRCGEWLRGSGFLESREAK